MELLNWNASAVRHRLVHVQKGGDRTGLFAGALMFISSSPVPSPESATSGPGGMLLVSENGANAFSGKVHLYQIEPTQNSNITPPILRETDVLTNAPFENENMGVSATASQDGEWLAFGSPAQHAYTGKVTLYRRMPTAAGVAWIFHQELHRPLGEWGESFGKEVAFSSTARYIAVAYGSKRHSISKRNNRFVEAQQTGYEHTAIFRQLIRGGGSGGTRARVKYQFVAQFMRMQFLEWSFNDHLFMWSDNASLQVATFRDNPTSKQIDVSVRKVLFANEIKCMHAHTLGNLFQLERIHFQMPVPATATAVRAPPSVIRGAFSCVSPPPFMHASDANSTDASDASDASHPHPHQWVQKRYAYADHFRTAPDSHNSSQPVLHIYLYAFEFDTDNPHVFYTNWITQFNATPNASYEHSLFLMSPNIAMIGTPATLTAWSRQNASHWEHIATFELETTATAHPFQFNSTFGWFTAAQSPNTGAVWIGVPSADALRGRLYYFKGWALPGTSGDETGTSGTAGIHIPSDASTPSLTIFILLLFGVVFLSMFSGYMCLMCGFCPCCRSAKNADDKKKKKKEEEYSPYKVASYVGYTELDDDTLLPTPPRPPHTQTPHRTVSSLPTHPPTNTYRKNMPGCTNKGDDDNNKKKTTQAYVVSPVQVATFNPKKELRGPSKETVVTYKK